MSLLQGFHKHHITPKYKGGSDAPENLVVLHPIDHAIAHFVRWKVYGNPADGWAYNRLLSGLKNELIPNLKGIPKPYMRKPKSEQTKAKMSAALIGRKRNPETIEKVRKALAGRIATESQLEILSKYRHLAWSSESQKKKSEKTKGVPRPYAKNSSPPSINSCRAGGKAGKGRKQTPEQIAKRVASRRATLDAQGRTR